MPLQSTLLTLAKLVRFKLTIDRRYSCQYFGGLHLGGVCYDGDIDRYDLGFIDSVAVKIAVNGDQ